MSLFTVPLFRQSRSVSLSALISLAVLSASVGCSRSLDAQDVDESFKRFLDFTEAKYVPPQGVGKQLIKFKLTVSPDLPKDAKILLQLNHQGLPIDGLKAEFVFKGGKRAGVVFDWELSKVLGPDDYQLQVTLDLKDQDEAVAKKFKRLSKTFPERLNPFTYPIFDKGKEIAIGTEEERAAQAELTCKLYDDHINQLLDNFGEFNDSVKKLRAGEKFHKGGKPNQKAYATYVREWRRKQGATQRGIIQEFREKHPTIVNRSLTAHANLIRLGRMVSRRAYNLQKEAEKEVGLTHVNPVPDPKDKKDAALPYFDRNYRYKVSADGLNRIMDTIVRLVCPEQEAGDDDDDDDASGKSGGTESGDAKKPASGAANKKGVEKGN